MNTEITIYFEGTVKSFTVEVYNNGWEWCAVEENYDGPEDHYRARGGKTKEEALEALAESLEELEHRNHGKP